MKLILEYTGCDYTHMLNFEHTSAYFNEIDKPALIGVRCAKKVKAIISRSIRKGTDIEQRLLRAISPGLYVEMKAEPTLYTSPAS